ncbi:serine-rich adhesin for platelets [Aplysia californica]|uniref:Serine-rich adhesin for platelets n=1 Tax=Aplysia californica TaxID=6500 RepID=A0ABM1VVS2_APLCA|nr:serine-rich adhesin for platelets [Aplysia californica]
MASESDETTRFVERTESTIGTPTPSQISAKKVLIRKSSNQENDLHNLERSEVNVEIGGFRETVLSSSEKVVSSTVRTVYERSASGGSSGNDVDSECGSSVDACRDSVFTDHVSLGLGVGGAGRERQLSSESHYISQTYLINSSDKASRSVSAVKDVKFKCSRKINLGGKGDGESKDQDQAGDQEEDLKYIDRCEVVIPGDDPSILESGDQQSSDRNSLSDMSQEEDREVLQIMQSVREDVQQMIETSYRVSDISDIIDNDMNPEARKQFRSAETSKKTLSNAEASMRVSSKDGSSSTRVESAAINIPPSPKRKTVGSSSESNTNQLSPDDDSPPRLAYSPGLAIRSYAMEELAEKKSRTTPERMEAAAKSLRFDFDSSEVDLSKGSSVDQLDSIPRLSAVDFSRTKKSPRDDQSERTSSTQDIQMFKLTKVHKVSLSDDLSYTDSQTSQDDAVTLEEQREAEDRLESLVDLQSLQAGYRFHDVGIMQSYSGGGICNPAFDDEYDEAPPQGGAVDQQVSYQVGQASAQTQAISSDSKSSTLSGQDAVTAQVTSSRETSATLTSAAGVQSISSENQVQEVPSATETQAHSLDNRSSTLAGQAAVSVQTRALSETPSSTLLSGSTMQQTVVVDKSQDLMSSSTDRQHVSLDSRSATVSGQEQSTVQAGVAFQTSSLLTSSSAVENVSLASKQDESKVMPEGTSSTSDSRSTTLGPQSEANVQVSAFSSTTLTSNSSVQRLSSSENVSLSQQRNEVSVESKSQQSVVDMVSKATIVHGPPVPVTRRFNVGKKFESALKSKGATLLSESLLLDTYYDTRSFDLTLSDCWLRSRNGLWQLHANFTKLLNGHTDHEYTEVENVQSIVDSVSQITGFKKSTKNRSIVSFLQSAGLVEFVRYKTTLKTYQLGDLKIDLHLPEYGFWVGSVTAFAPSKSRTHEGVKAIQNFWSTTGVEALCLTRG